MIEALRKRKAAVSEPIVQIRQGLEPRTRREPTAADEAQLVLDLPLLAARSGRVEIRIATISHDAGRLRDQHGWPGLKAVGRIAAGRERKGRTERAVRPLHYERGDSAGAAAGARPQPLGGSRTASTGFSTSSWTRAGMPLRPPARRPEHRAPHGRRPLAQGTDAYRFHERQISARSSRERGRQILRAKALLANAASIHMTCKIGIVRRSRKQRRVL